MNKQNKTIPKYNFIDHEIEVEVVSIEGKIDNSDEVVVAKPHKHHFYEIVWHTNAGDVHTIDFKPHKIAKDRIFLMGPNRVHSMDTTNLTGHLFFFSENFMSMVSEYSKNEFFNIFYTSEDLPFIDPTNDEKVELLSIVELITNEYNKNNRDTRIIQKYFQIFLLNLQRIKQKSEKKIYRKNFQYIASILSSIDQNFKEKKKASFYSLQAGLSIKRANEILKEVFDKTITELVHDRLIIEAKREIIFGNENIRTISQILGFEDPAYFSRFFKKKTGMTTENFKSENSTI